MPRNKSPPTKNFYVNVWIGSFPVERGPGGRIDNFQTHPLIFHRYLKSNFDVLKPNLMSHLFFRLFVRTLRTKGTSPCRVCRLKIRDCLAKSMWCDCSLFRYTGGVRRRSDKLSRIAWKLKQKRFFLLF